MYVNMNSEGKYMELGMEKVYDNTVLLENYMGLLNSLSREYKIKLVEYLNSDIKNNVVPEADWIDKLYGSFVSDKSVEDMISEIRSSRRFNRGAIEF
ncbi:MAG: hypothetical protein Ta2B_18130 [Termitinemataceae bacterium]|nr:MAG: hypothetical protein Ta2B_18130 [Termitinemataceae bacterium]